MNPLSEEDGGEDYWVESGVTVVGAEPGTPGGPPAPQPPKPAPAPAKVKTREQWMEEFRDSGRRFVDLPPEEYEQFKEIFLT